MNERIWNQRMLGLTFNVEDGRITIFRSTLEALGWPTHYRFLYNREAKQVAVQNCTAEDAGGGTGTIHIVWRGKASPDSNL